MKISIVYTSTGAGHAKTAEALYYYIRRHGRRCEVQLLDVLEQSDLIFRKFYSFGYSFMVKHAQWLWKILYYITAQRHLQPPLSKVRSIHNAVRLRGFIKYLLEEQPDVVVATHFLPAAITSYLKEEYKISSKLISIVTDFGVHPFWVYDYTDYYCVATEKTKNQLEQLGVRKNKILVTGIPIDDKFTQKLNKEKMRLKIGIEPNKFTVLLMTGSFGIGPLEQITDALHTNVQLIVVCAQNKHLFKRLKAKNYTSAKIFGYVNNIAELMAASDCIVTKPGGLTIAELLAMELPPIFISAIPGQEMENIRVLAEYGIVSLPSRRSIWSEATKIGIKKAKVVAQAVRQKVLTYLRQPEKLEVIRQKIRQLKRPKACEEIYHVIR
ncbi:MAG: hypothetical protein N2606_04195 [Candidatus Omnitrophica bacterium]|nr:hypothetical protein [Candidatus Omnitrophota bacterium]